MLEPAGVVVAAEGVTVAVGPAESRPELEGEETPCPSLWFRSRSHSHSRCR